MMQKYKTILNKIHHNKKHHTNHTHTETCKDGQAVLVKFVKLLEPPSPVQKFLPVPYKIGEATLPTGTS